MTSEAGLACPAVKLRLHLGEKPCMQDVLAVLGEAGARGRHFVGDWMRVVRQFMRLSRPWSLLIDAIPSRQSVHLIAVKLHRASN